jgi:hypothetical protein
MRGDQVIVRAFEGEPLVRRIWKVHPDAIDICDNNGYQRLLAGEFWMPIGFPRRDVFRYDPEILEKLMAEWRVNPAVWENLTVWADDLELQSED